MIVDYKRLGNGTLKDGFLTVLEQMPGKVMFEDQTKHLLGKWFDDNKS